MEFIPVKTRILQPPKDDLFNVLDEYLTDVREGDVVLISSKVIAIHQGRCVPEGEAEKEALVVAEADVVIERPYWGSPLTIVHNTFLGASGIDESNSDGHYVLLPERIFESAHEIYTYLKKRHNLENIAVIVTDSRSLPLRYGAVGVGLAFWGMHPLESHIGKLDLFGREMKIERSNIVDALSAGANLVSGEVAERQPIVIARDVPSISFTETDCRHELMATFEDDTFRVLYERYL